MKSDLFVFWYYSRGLIGLFEIWKNFVHFFWRYFSVRDLATTLFYPWKKDITWKNWIGWHPFKTINGALNNFVSRLIGFLVRVTVIVFAVVLELIFITLGLVVFVFWAIGPLFFLVGIVQAITNNVFQWIIISGLFYFVVCISYLASRQRNLRELSYRRLSRHPVFQRIADRFEKEKYELLGILEDHEKYVKFLDQLGISAIKFREIVEWELDFWEAKTDRNKFWKKDNLDKIRPIGRFWKYAYTVRLDQFSEDLTQFDHTEYSAIRWNAHKAELDMIRLIAERPGQNNVLLVGDAGIGKKSTIHYLARKIRLGLQKGILQDKRVVLFDLGQAIASASRKGGDAENVLHSIFQELIYAENVILVIENIEKYLGRSSDLLYPDVAGLLSEYMPITNFQVIATSTLKEYHRLVEKYEYLMKYFEVIEMKEVDEEATLKIVKEKLEPFEKKRVIFSFPALRTIVEKSHRHSANSPLPERALDLAMEIFLFWRKTGDPFVTPELIDQFLSIKTGMPMGEITRDETAKLMNLEKLIHERIIGQEEAVTSVAEAMRRIRAGITDENKPIGSFLFLGPTGVGKTELAKALSDIYFGNEGSMIRLDMSEFQNASSIDRLIGSTELKQPGRLINLVKDYPYSLLLLDEIEKASPDILDLFLQILDEGYVTDAFGEKVSFSNMIIIATSNAGAALIKDMVEKKQVSQKIKAAVIDETVKTGTFRLEFLNRFDGIIFFRPLTEVELNSVVRLMLNKLKRKLKKEKSIELEFGDQVVSGIIEKGYNPIFGARSIYHFIKDRLEDGIAKQIITGDLKKGGSLRIEELPAE